MTGRIHALDGVRGYAAVSVLIFHAILASDTTLIDRVVHRPVLELSTPYEVWAKFWLTLFNGDAAVTLFFMLSGCVLMLSLGRDFARHSRAATAVAFVIRRIMRIYPAAIVCVLAIVAVVWLHALAVPQVPWPYTMTGIWQNLLLISPDVNGATWTLFVELFAIPFLLITGYLMWICGWPPAVGFLVFAILARNEPWLVLGSAWTAHYLFYFAFGCLIPSAAGAAAARLADRIGWVALLIGFVAVVVLHPYLGFKIMLLQGFCGFLLLSLLYHRPPAGLGSFLTRPVSLYLGRVSYGFYLWHGFFIVMLTRTVFLWPEFAARHAVEIGLLVSLPLTVVTALVADLSERFVEQPGIRLGRWLSQRIFEAGRSRAGDEAATRRGAA